MVLLNFLFGAAKLAIWCTRKNKVEGRESVDTVLMMRGFIKKRLMMEYAYYNLINDVESFFHVWGEVLYVKLMIREVLYAIYEYKRVYFFLFLIIIYLMHEKL